MGRNGANSVQWLREKGKAVALNKTTVTLIVVVVSLFSAPPASADTIV
jgi:hypothetical protein